MIARIEAQFHLPVDRTEVESDRMTIELARLLAQKGLMLAPAAGADEFEGSPYVLQADRQVILADEG